MGSELLKRIPDARPHRRERRAVRQNFRRHGRRRDQGRAAAGMLDAAYTALSRRSAGRRSQPLLHRLPGRQTIGHAEPRARPTAARCSKTWCANADFLLESFPVGYLESIGLGYDALAELNPRIIYTSSRRSATRDPAESTRPPTSSTWAAGGPMFLMGEEGRPPLEMALPQAGLHAGAEAAVASLHRALFARA